MAGRQAKTLLSDHVNDLLLFADCSRNLLRNRAIVLLSAKAGLRAGEIAKLTWDMVVDGDGLRNCTRAFLSGWAKSSDISVLGQPAERFYLIWRS